LVKEIEFLLYEKNKEIQLGKQTKFTTLDEFKKSILGDVNIPMKRRRMFHSQFPDYLWKILLFSNENKLAPAFVVESVLNYDTFYTVNNDTEKIMAIATLKFLENKNCECAYIDSFTTHLNQGISKPFLSVIETIAKRKHQKKYIVLCSLRDPYTLYESVGYKLIDRNNIHEYEKLFKSCGLTKIQKNEISVNAFGPHPDRTIHGLGIVDDSCLYMIKKISGR